MFKLISIFVFAVLVADTIGQQPYIIFPTYQPPPQGPVTTRTVREAPTEEPWYLYRGNPNAPSSDDDNDLISIISSWPVSRRGYTHIDSSSSKLEHLRQKRNLGFMPRQPTFPKPGLPSPFDPFGPRPGTPRRPYPIYVNH